MPSDNLIGTQIGDFTVHAVIGRGGMATVYRATQSLLQREVALKVIRLDDVSDKNRDFAPRFATEVNVIASLEHPNILPVYSYGVTETVAYLAMRLLRGGSLDSLTHREPLPFMQALDVFHQTAQALAHAHSKGIIHRDIKPSNILLDEHGHVYLTDFGLAKLINSDNGVTRTGQIMGTPIYMSPEQLRGETLDFRSDVYALGCILYELLTGAPPFPLVDGDVIPVIYRHLQTPPDAPSTANPSISPAMDDIVLRALAKDPAARFPSVRDFAAAVQQASGQRPTVSMPLPADVIVNRTQPMVVVVQPQRGVLLAVAAILAALMVSTILLFRSETDRQAREAATASAAALIMQQRTSSAIEQAAADATRTAVAFVPRFDPAQIILGEESRLQDLRPDEAEIELARRAIGMSGFIAIIPCNTSSEYHAALVREISSFARDHGLTVRVYDPDSDAYRQLTLIERAIAEAATGIVICPLDIALITPSMAEARRARIPIVSQASGMGEFGGVQVLTDPTLLGRKPGEYIGKLVRDTQDGQARVVVMTFDDLPDVKARADGMIAGMLEFAPDAEVVARVRGATIEWGREAIQALIDSQTHFDVILSINDAGAFGAVDVLEDAGIPYDSVMIGSVDAEILAQRYIRDGKYFRATVETGRTVYAGAAVDIMIKLLAGASLPEYVYIEPGELYTRENIDAAP